jgi:hypothetical protein
MKCHVITSLCLGGVLAFVSVVQANTGDAPAQADSPDVSSDQQPYSAIWTRNVFDLKPPEEKITTKAPEVAPPSNIKLMGIYTIFGKRALLSVQEAAGAGKPQGKEEFYNMSEGERHGVLELVEINPTARTVKIKNEEIVSTITFETNKAPAAMAGGGPRPPGMNGFTPPPPAMGQPGTPMPLPSRSIRSSSPNLLQPSAAGYQSGYQPMGGNSLFSPAMTQQNALGSANQNISAEEAMTQFYLQQAAHQGDANFPPPLPLPPGLSSGNENNNSGGLPTPPSTRPPVPPQFRPKVTGSYPALP